VCLLFLPHTPIKHSFSPTHSTRAHTPHPGALKLVSCHYWNNFEVLDLDHFRTRSGYMQYFDFLDAEHGFWRYRWGDALVRTLGVHLFADPSQVHRFHDIGYSHQHYCMNPCGAVRSALADARVPHDPHAPSSADDEFISAHIRCDRELDAYAGIGEHCSWWEQRTRDTDPGRVVLVLLCVLSLLALTSCALRKLCSFRVRDRDSLSKTL
jgi:Glycolipid 2-alpha-mannosyltransferase